MVAKCSASSPCNGRCELVISVSLCCLPAGHYRGLFFRCFVGGVSFVSFGLFLSFYLFFISIFYFFCHFFLFFIYCTILSFLSVYPVLSCSLPLSFVPYSLLSYPSLPSTLLFTSSLFLCAFISMFLHVHMLALVHACVIKCVSVLLCACL